MNRGATSYGGGVVDRNGKERFSASADLFRWAI